MYIISLFDDSFKTLLTNSINLYYLSKSGYAKRYGYMEDNVFPILKDYKIFDYDNARIMKVQTIDTINNIWFIGYKDYFTVSHDFFSDVMQLPTDKIYIGKSITPTLVGECKYIDYTNILFNTACIEELNKPKQSYYYIIDYFTEILSGIIECTGNEEEFNKKYKNTYFFNAKQINNRLEYARLAASYHFYNILHNSGLDKNRTILTNIEYTVKNEENSIYDQCGLNLNDFEIFVNKVRHYMSKM